MEKIINNNLPKTKGDCPMLLSEFDLFKKNAGKPQEFRINNNFYHDIGYDLNTILNVWGEIKSGNTVIIQRKNDRVEFWGKAKKARKKQFIIIKDEKEGVPDVLPDIELEVQKIIIVRYTAIFDKIVPVETKEVNGSMITVTVGGNNKPIEEIKKGINSLPGCQTVRIGT